MKKKTRDILRISVILSVIILLGVTLWFNFTSDIETVQAGDKAIDFQLETLNGDQIQLSDVNSEKGVILNFWGRGVNLAVKKCLIWTEFTMKDMKTMKSLP